MKPVAASTAKTVVVADDTAFVRDRFRSALEAAGHRAVMLFLIQIGSAKQFKLARDIDPKYGAAYDRARSRGVEAMAWKCRIDEAGIEIDTPVPIVD